MKLKAGEAIPNNLKDYFAEFIPMNIGACNDITIRHNYETKNKKKFRR
jgi:hypothetical protein